MALASSRYIFILAIFTIIPAVLYGQKHASISGKLSLDDTWSATLYLSHIPTFDDMYVMSNEMIIARTAIDSLGHFKFDVDYLPADENLFRLHIVKKGDSPATLIIGGKDENHVFLIARGSSTIQLTGNSLYPPFKNVAFQNSTENTDFQRITNYFSKADSAAAESSASKRLLIEKQLEKDLFLMADTSTHFLVSLYAIYKNRFPSNYTSHEKFYTAYIKKWNNQENAYFNSFKNQLPVHTDNSTIIIAVVFACVLTLGGFIFGKYGLPKSNKIEKLSVQERKIYEMLQRGASNQEISDNFNIGLSTVKSHVGSIYSKLNVKSRKGIVNVK